MRYVMLASLLLLPLPALAGTKTLAWDPVPGATAYEIEQSVNDGGAWTKVGSDVLAAACTGTPARCTMAVTTPATGLTLYRIVAKDAVRRTTRLEVGAWVNESWTPLTAPANIGGN